MLRKLLHFAEAEYKKSPANVESIRVRFQLNSSIVERFEVKVRDDGENDLQNCKHPLNTNVDIVSADRSSLDHVSNATINLTVVATSCEPITDFQVIGDNDRLVVNSEESSSPNVLDISSHSCRTAPNLATPGTSFYDLCSQSWTGTQRSFDPADDTKASTVPLLLSLHDASAKVPIGFEVGDREFESKPMEIPENMSEEVQQCREEFDESQCELHETRKLKKTRTDDHHIFLHDAGSTSAEADVLGSEGVDDEQQGKVPQPRAVSDSDECVEKDAHIHIKINVQQLNLGVDDDRSTDRVLPSSINRSDPLLLGQWPRFLWPRTHTEGLPSLEDTCAAVERGGVVAYWAHSTWRIKGNLALQTAAWLANKLHLPLVAFVVVEFDTFDDMNELTKAQQHTTPNGGALSPPTVGRGFVPHRSAARPSFLRKSAHRLSLILSLRTALQGVGIPLVAVVAARAPSPTAHSSSSTLRTSHIPSHGEGVRRPATEGGDCRDSNDSVEGAVSSLLEALQGLRGVAALVTDGSAHPIHTRRHQLLRDRFPGVAWFEIDSNSVVCARAATAETLDAAHAQVTSGAADGAEIKSRLPHPHSLFSPLSSHLLSDPRLGDGASMSSPPLRAPFSASFFALFQQECESVAAHLSDWNFCSGDGMRPTCETDTELIVSKLIELLSGLQGGSRSGGAGVGGISHLLDWTMVEVGIANYFNTSPTASSSTSPSSSFLRSRASELVEKLGIGGSVSNRVGTAQGGDKSDCNVMFDSVECMEECDLPVNNNLYEELLSPGLPLSNPARPSARRARHYLRALCSSLLLRKPLGVGLDSSDGGLNADEPYWWLSWDRDALGGGVAPVLEAYSTGLLGPEEIIGAFGALRTLRKASKCLELHPPNKACWEGGERRSGFGDDDPCKPAPTTSNLCNDLIIDQIWACIGFGMFEIDAAAHTCFNGCLIPSVAPINIPWLDLLPLDCIEAIQELDEGMDFADQPPRAVQRTGVSSIKCLYPAQIRDGKTGDPLFDAIQCALVLGGVLPRGVLAEYWLLFLMMRLGTVSIGLRTACIELAIHSTALVEESATLMPMLIDHVSMRVVPLLQRLCLAPPRPLHTVASTDWELVSCERSEVLLGRIRENLERKRGEMAFRRFAMAFSGDIASNSPVDKSTSN